MFTKLQSTNHIFYVHSTISKICLVILSLQDVSSLHSAFLRADHWKNHSIQYARSLDTFARPPSTILHFYTSYTQVHLERLYFLSNFRYGHTPCSWIIIFTIRFKDFFIDPFVKGNRD